ncbi:MAG TPA: TonB-dependent receptor [Verrucomicrobiae bacterium]|nr:TonB-dependent receptor [Verrucomicrobiae bacterium]
MSGLSCKIIRRVGRVVIAAWLMTLGSITFAQTNSTVPARDDVRIAALQGNVEVMPAGAKNWVPAQTNLILHPFDRIRSGENSRVALFWPVQSVVPFGASTEIEILPPKNSTDECGLHLIRGVISFFHRDKPGRIQVITRGAVAGVEGTEFVMAVDSADVSTLSVVDGKVKFGNEQAALLLTSGEQAVAEPGKKPVRTAGFIANNLLQWCFYYPAILDLNDLPLSADEQKNLSQSLNAYRAGDVPAALDKFPSKGMNSDDSRIYYAALLLSVGDVENAEKVLSSMTSNSGRSQRLADALRQLIAAVKKQNFSPGREPELTTEFLARSYYEQSRAVPKASLENALKFARLAATNSPQNGFALERVAELEFSFGRKEQALSVLNKSLVLAPRNPEALALKGFILASRNHSPEAISWFDRALAVNPEFGNAWLGRGLSRIRIGDKSAGYEDLLMAAALEPQRAELRSYLGKGYMNAGDYSHAQKELKLAKKLDPNDPTAWLYSALLAQEENRVNDAIRDLEKSEALNDNRGVYRSQLLLDQDQAVRSENLAAMYRDAGMDDVALNEAMRAENLDYGNYAAHLFAGNSYQQLRDPNENNLRYDTPAENEYMLANLLAPSTAGVISPIISQQAYSKLFEDNGFGIASDSIYLSRGAWDETGAQFGTYDGFSYALEAHYRGDPGERPNDDIEERTLSLTLKQQLTPADDVYAQIINYDAGGGDTAQYYSQSFTSKGFRYTQDQEPTALLGYHHEWSPGSHTLLLFSRVSDNFTFTNPAAEVNVPFLPNNSYGIPQLTGVTALYMREHLDSETTLYSTELQQLYQTPEHNTIVGARAQYAHFDIYGLQNWPSTGGALFRPPPEPSAQEYMVSDFYHGTLYGYHQWQVLDSLQLIGGLSYDWLMFPENMWTGPVSGLGRTKSQFSPKAGLIWTPAKNTTFRFGYARWMADASLGYQLEPSQVAGFVQSYRSIIPDSVATEYPGNKFEIYGISLEQKFNTGTYLSFYGGLLNSTVSQLDGSLAVLGDKFNYAIPMQMPEHLDYTEKTFQFAVSQLAGRDWSFGAQYRISEAILDDDFPGVKNNLILNNFHPRQREQAVLQQLNLTAIYNHPSGFFAEGQALWNSQDSGGYTVPLPGDDYWQFNAFAGWRFFHRHAELKFGVLNITGQTYNLNPLNFYTSAPQKRTFFTELKINF